jgi:flavin-binding protein dodecin
VTQIRGRTDADKEDSYQVTLKTGFFKLED